MPRNIEYLVQHCSATLQAPTLAELKAFASEHIIPYLVKYGNNPSVDDITEKHAGLKGEVEFLKLIWHKWRGWRDVGYHKVVTSDGHEHQLMHYNLVSNGVAGYNSKSINICYIGGVDANGVPQDNRTDAQKETLKCIFIGLNNMYKTAEGLGHRDFPGVNKACPSFDFKPEFTRIINGF